MNDIQKKTVLITGASRGIGRGTALAFAKKGYQIVANYCHSEKEIKELQLEMDALSVPFLPICADITNSKEVVNMVGVAQKEFGNIDVLVNNAGVSLIRLFQDTTDEEWHRIFDVNINGAFYTTKAVLPQMIQNQQGTIINVSSIWGVAGASCEVAYSASKAALIGFTKALAKEVGPSHITVNCVAPGVVLTDMNQALTQSVMEELKEETPLGVLGSVEDISKAIMFLASEDAQFITGQVLNVNGGLVI